MRRRREHYQADDQAHAARAGQVAAARFQDCALAPQNEINRVNFVGVLKSLKKNMKKKNHPTIHHIFNEICMLLK